MHIGLTGWQREALDGDPRRLLDLFARVDALGYDSIWFNELHFRRHGLPYPSAIALAALVDQTGIAHLRCVFNGAGATDHDATRAALALFAAEVLPAARAICPPAHHPETLANA